MAWISLVLVPAVFSFVYLALPLRTWHWTLPVGLALVLVTWGLEEADLDAVANFSKLAAATLLGFWFISLFETVGLVVFVACLIPWIDAYSVWRGPTSNIVSNHPQVFTSVSFALPIPGENDAARLGPPDILFFALFLAAADRFGLRVFWTWLALALSFGATLDDRRRRRHQRPPCPAGPLDRVPGREHRPALADLPARLGGGRGRQPHPSLS